jgi:two-component system nitrogen regulation sensor histidine kinase NtrY
MSLRRRLLVLFALTVLVSVAAVTLIVSAMTRRAFDRANDERTAALVGQFRREFTRRGEDVSRRVQAVAATSEVSRIAIAAARPAPDYSIFLDEAQTIAETQQLDFLEFADDRGTIISSAQWPAKFGYQEALVTPAPPASPFLKEEETPAGSALGLFGIRSVAAGDRKLFVIGGIRLDKTFLASLELPAGMRVLLYENLDHESFLPGHLIGPADSTADPQEFAPLIRQVQQSAAEATAVVHENAHGSVEGNVKGNSHSDSGDDETVNAIPLTGENNQLRGILLVGSSRQIYTELRGQIRSAALLAAGVGLVMAVLLSSWAAARVTRPVEELAHAAGEIAGGNWNTQVASTSRDEIGQLADSFNHMTRDLLDQRERLVQAERVAAWRELARRLAHELKNPLFPLQLTVENLLRARQQGEQQFNETFHESASALLAEISNLKTIIGRFSDFSKMPQPQLQAVRMNELLREAVKLHQAQLSQANIKCQLQLSETWGQPPSAVPRSEALQEEPIAADPDLLHRALSNLILNAIEAMPAGGTLTLRAREDSGSACIQVSDTGKGLSQEECARLFTPYYTSKVHGTGLGLAIVQSIVSDHAGRISVSSEPGHGTTFIIELPANRDKLSATNTPVGKSELKEKP